MSSREVEARPGFGLLLNSSLGRCKFACVRHTLALALQLWPSNF